MTMLTIVTMLAAAGLPAWEFSSEADLQAWVPNSALANVAVADGAVTAEATDWDPFFHLRGLELEANPWQYVAIRMKASASGMGNLFWSGETSGEHGGLTENKKVDFAVDGNGEWEEIVLFPFWHTEGTIRQLRLDVYQDARIGIDSIRIGEWGGEKAPLTNVTSWSFDNDLAVWKTVPGTSLLMSPRLELNVDNLGWATVFVRAEQDGVGAVLWAARGVQDMQRESFSIRGDGSLHAYNIELQGGSRWQSPVVALGLELPEGAEVQKLSLNADPAGPPEIITSYFGFENAMNRAGRTCSILAQFENRGGGRADGVTATLVLPEGLTLVGGEATQALPAIAYEDKADLTWQVRAERQGDSTVSLKVEGDGAPAQAPETTLTFKEAREVTPAEYVPEPQPIDTTVDVAAYYFPGWSTPGRWDCIRGTAPIRKPLLGYYDESLPEIVDWQIKWSTENGIGIYLLDWYWSQGNQHLEHWLAAYKQAKYRDKLKIALMWANHNAPNTHSREDWRNVTQHWLDNIFTLPSYYRIDDKPAVFIWAPSNIRRDLGGSEEAAAAYAESQEMAKQAGYGGITFVAMGYDMSQGTVEALVKEGYYGCTTYHEWGTAGQAGQARGRMDYADVAATTWDAWMQHEKASDGLIYYPVADTGWDSRPWHGNKSFVIYGRTPELFGDVLDQQEKFAKQEGKDLVILAPLNEWGEGSYIEPCTEFDFDMLEQVRRAYGDGDPASWPENIAPGDIGRGPYDFPVVEGRSNWTFDEDAGGWGAMMGVSNVRVEDGMLLFETGSQDPALILDLTNTRATEYTKAVVRMRVNGASQAEGMRAQLFWSRGGRNTSEADSVSVPIVADGETHEYVLDLAPNPRWRGNITSLRFDPLSAPGLQIAIDSFELRP